MTKTKAPGTRLPGVFGVSLGMVKKLLQCRRRTGDIAPRHRFAGRKPMIVAAHRSQIRACLAKKNDLTLSELRGSAGAALLGAGAPCRAGEDGADL
jgi:hypothetical protein